MEKEYQVDTFLRTPVVSVKNLTTRLRIGKRRIPVVNNLSFDLYPGKTLALVGESGCGKSMTALSLLRIAPEMPTGEVIYQGQNLLALSERKMRKLRGSKIAMIFQDPMTALNPVYTIGDQLMEVGQLHLGLDPKGARERAVEALEDVGVPPDRLKAYPHQLSGGMKQRVMIAMALICEPDLLIADEPTTALDVTVQAQVLDLMRDLQKKRGMALLLITHDMGVVAEMADEVVVMYASRAVEIADVHTLFDSPAHPYTQGLFASRPTTNARLTPIEGVVPPLGSFPPGCAFHPRCPKALGKCCHGDVPTCHPTNQQQVSCWLYEPAHR